METLKKIALLLSFLAFFQLAARCQGAGDIPFYGNVVPGDSGAVDLGSSSLIWDTIFVNNIQPPVAGSGIWFETNDSTIRWSFGGDTVFFYISNGTVKLGSDAALNFGVKGNNPFNFNGTSSTAAGLRLYEDTDNGTNYVEIKANSSISANKTYTITQAAILPPDSALQDLGSAAKRFNDVIAQTATVRAVNITGITIDTTAGDAATINATAGRFRKDTSGSAFTLTNSYINSGSVVIVSFASDPGATGYDAPVIANGPGNCVVTFKTAGAAAAPAANTDINFIVIN